MNLITIDNKKLWSKKKRNLLVGNWCIDNEHRYKKSKNKKYMISEYHWNDKAKFRKDVKYLQKIYNSLLENLYLNLNKFHNLKYPKRYWEILLWKWLLTYLFMTYDKWEVINSIKKKNKNLSSKFFSYSTKNFIPKDSLEFTTSIMHSDDYIHWIYSKILMSVGGVKCNFINKNEIKPKFLYKKNEYRSANYLLTSFLRQHSLTPFFSPEKIYSQNMYFSKKFEILYNLLERQFRYSSEISERDLNIPLNMKARYNFIKLSKKEDKFAKFAHSLIKHQLPKIYLEHYGSMKEMIQKSKTPKNPRILITSIDHIWNEAFKFYSAEKVLNGSKLFTIQHGACYGITDYNMDEKIEIKISDKFLTWGWKENKKTLPLFLQNNVYKKVNKKSNASGLIMPVTEFYLDSECDFTQGSPRNKIEVNKYIDNIVLFVNQINQSILKESSFKHLDNIKCNYVLKSLKYKFPNFRFVNSKRNTCAISNSFKLTVETLNGTGFLQSLNLNIPVILIYDKKYCSLRKSAVKHFNMLRKVKIVHNSAQEAAKFVNENYNDLEKWWNSKLLQKVKNKFCHNFARKSNSPLKDLKKILFV